MVGVPRSKGCSLCVKRRVKLRPGPPRCVEEPRTVLRPKLTIFKSTVCGNCARYGAECPGYGRDWKFVSGKHAVRSQRTAGRGEPRYDVLLSFSSRRSPPTPILTRVVRDASPIPSPLRQGCVPFIYGMMGQLFSIHSRDEVFYTAPWFSSMLNYLGQEPVLDSAMSALMLQMVGKAKGDKGIQDICWGRDLYGRTLGMLQRTLDHPTAWKAVETFAATILCCIYEVSRSGLAFHHILRSPTYDRLTLTPSQLFAGTTNALSWMMHAEGISKLIQARGPGSIKTPFEKALLRSARPILVSEATSLVLFFL